MTNKLFYFFIFCFYAISLNAQTPTTKILQKRWRANWITVPDASPNGYGVYMFRKNLDIATQPKTYIVHVSADNRYKLFVNEQWVSLGPARGDINHWNYETVDIAPYLHTGKNIVAAQVWNEGDGRPEAQISLQTGFILQAATDAENSINTNYTWQCARDSSYAPLKVSLATYYVAGSGELINLKNQPKNWKKVDFDDSKWQSAKTIFGGTPKELMGEYGSVNGWMLVPSSIPAMELKMERITKVVKALGVQLPSGFPNQTTNLKIPANTEATILFDQTYLTNAYPTLIFSGGKGGGISLTYAEALFKPNGEKGNRDEIVGKNLIGRKDSLISDGTFWQTFTPLTFRTYRYLQVKVSTKNEPLALEGIYGTSTGYPFKFNALLESENTDFGKILDIGWRTARLCAVETYFDCPYYEQLQYIGDTRIQAMVSLYNSGDDRLVRNALNLLDNSREPEGVTLSRYPSFTQQYIPTFSLWYIGMLHDYAMYGKDANFIKNKLSGERAILNYFANYQQTDGSLKNVPYWMFTDWVTAKDWQAGRAPISKDCASALYDLQLLLAYQTASDLETKLGMKEYAALYSTAADLLKKTIQTKYWDAERKMYADRVEKNIFSQHANALAILTGVISGSAATDLAQKTMTDTTLAPASIYFRYYVHQAYIKAGLGDDYTKWLDIWRENMAQGLTTWAEMSDITNSRSDCHAWGSSPNIEFFRTLLGIDSDGLNFSTVKIEPHLGDIKNISGKMPHPNGTLSVRYKLVDTKKWQISIDLPPNTSGSFIWKGKKLGLKAGVNGFEL